VGGQFEYARRLSTIPVPYVAAKSAGEALATSYASELIRFGIETAIIIPGRFETGTNHFAHKGNPATEIAPQPFWLYQRARAASASSGSEHS
jgi:NAD(P)-dependent dehydrogenase (short-subunit alcohol dehydrogenase family)